MNNHLMAMGLAMGCALSAAAQPVFTDATSLLSDSTHSGNCTGVIDMDGDGLDDIATLHLGDRFVVYYQQANGTYSRYDYGIIANEHQWGFALGDTDHDGHKDMVAGGSYDGVHHLRISARGTAQPVSDLNNGSLYMQCMNMADINNDGRLDAFGCHDDGAPRIWINNGSGALMNATPIDFATTPASDMSGNYGSVWTDFDNDGDLDLFIAHCRQGVNNPEDPRRWNRLFVNNGSNQYSDQAAAYGLLNKSQSWSVDFGDIDNDGDLDLVVTNHDNTIQLFENNGTGHFTDITANSGLAITGFFLQSHFEDFDNDGFLDLLVTGMGEEHYFSNDGDKTFTYGAFPMSTGKEMHSFGIGDLNNDGFPDVFASYAEGYVTPDEDFADKLWLNTPNANHWFNVVLQGTVSNPGAVGARVTLHTALGTQVREVRSGESYGIVNTSVCHFGLGANDHINSMVVRWPNGTEQTWTDLHADQVMTVVEGGCASANVDITTSGAPVICSGQSLTLTAPNGYAYLWNNGSTASTITVTTPGMYVVRLTNGSGCVGHAGVLVQVDPDETPSVNVTGATSFCEGGEVVLTSSPAANYTWSNGATTQSISVTNSGNYTVTVDGTCGDFTSAGVMVEVADAPPAPTAADVTIPAPGTAVLSATGLNIKWYAEAVGGTSIGSGSPWTTPVVNTNTSFWAADLGISQDGPGYGGLADRTSQGAYHTNNGNYLVFEADEPFILRSVKVYSNNAVNKTVQLTDAADNVLASVTAQVPVGESRIQLDFDVPAGGPYGLRSGDSNPQLWRDQRTSALGYPFQLGTLGAITGTSVSGATSENLYYFFYDWEVQAEPVACESPREEVLVSIGGVGIEEGADGAGLQAWPNPASDLLTITAKDLVGPVRIELLDLTGRSVLAQGANALAGQEGRTQLAVDGLARGGYVLRVRHGGGDRMLRITLR